MKTKYTKKRNIKLLPFVIFFLMVASGIYGSDIWENDGNIGIGTSNPKFKLEVNGSFSAGGIGSYKKTYGVDANTDVKIKWNENTATLDTSYRYKVTAITLGTGTDTATKYIIYYVESENKWQARLVSHPYLSHSSNYPDISVDGDNMYVSHKHGAKYSIQVIVEHIHVSESDALPHIFGADYMWIRDNNTLYYSDGFVGIGIENPEHDLHVSGTVKAEQFLVSNSEWADYVFEPWYTLKSFEELGSFIKQNKHLPNIPNEASIAENGYDVADMQRLHMEKIEELHLYILQLHERIKHLENN